MFLFIETEFLLLFRKCYGAHVHTHQKACMRHTFGNILTGFALSVVLDIDGNREVICNCVEIL